MSFPSSLSVSPIGNSPNLESGLRAYQRVTAQIVSVTGTTAILEIDGQPVVAQLTSQEQSAALTSRQTAHFLVTQLTDDVVTLKLVDNESTKSLQLNSNQPELAVRLLEQFNLPMTVGNLLIARAMLKQHLPVTPETVHELLRAFPNTDGINEADADLAAAMKSAGLPVTAETLGLGSRTPAQTSEALSRLMASLSRAASQGLPEEVMQQLKSAMQGLRALVVDSGSENSQLADQLKAAVEALGRSLENILLQNPIPEHGLMSLVKLQQLLEGTGKPDTAKAIQDFLNDLRLNQFMNAKPESSPRGSEWTMFGFALQNMPQQSEKEFSSARLRIAHEGGTGTINPQSTRLILQVDVRSDETVEVDLSLAGKQIRASVTTPDSSWREEAENEMPSLVEALSQLGYALNHVQVQTGSPQSFGRIQPSTDLPPLLTVNIEV